VIFLKSQDQIEIMHEANCIVHACLDAAEREIRPGVTTQHIDEVISYELLKYPGATPAFLGYHNYPAYSCISINEEVVHGIPGNRMICEGDAVSVDFGVFWRGFAGDSARTILVGEVGEDVVKLSNETRRGLFAGIEQMVVGNRLNDINLAIESISKQNGYGNIRNFSGHGIGQKMHEKPSVFNYIEPSEPNVRLREGMVLALEPMFSLGSSNPSIKPDGWTVVTEDSSISCHWEFSIAITDHGPRILGDAG